MIEDSIHNNVSWDNSDLLNKLEENYKSKGLEEYWKVERFTIASRLDALDKRLKHRYGNPSLIGVGGSGVVLSIEDRQLGRRRFALKFPRPVPGKAELLVSMMDKEISHLLQLRHRSIVRIHTAGKVDEGDGEKTECPFYIMDYLTGQSSSNFFTDKEVKEQKFVRIIRDIIDALSYLHINSTAHLDIKPGNILIDENHIPVIADLGTAKSLREDRDLTVVACTIPYADPRIIRLLEKDPSDPNRAKGLISRSDLKSNLDLHPLGLTILEWMGYRPNGQFLHSQLSLSPYYRKYILLLVSRLLHHETTAWLHSLVGINQSFLQQIRYKELKETLLDVKKLTGEYSLVDNVPELNVYHPGSIQVTRDAPTTYSKRVELLLRHPELRRLASIRQLGLVNQVYPTATHSRLEHSIGTYHNTCRIILSLYYDPISPLLRQILDEVDVRATLVAALLHDIGHYPLAHDLEEVDSRFFDHGVLGIAMLRGARDRKRAGSRKIEFTSLDNVLEAWDVTQERVLAILESELDKYSCPAKDRILHSIIDGPIDADKLDYLIRDSERLGVKFSRGIDVDRIIRSLTPILTVRRGSLTACIGVHEKGKVSAEFVAIARYAMYSQAYWHHTVRAIKSMLSRAVMRLLVIADDKGEKWKNSLQSDFEEFALALPAGPLQQHPQQLYFGDFKQWSDDEIGSITTSEISIFSRGTIAETDAAIIAFLKNKLSSLDAPEVQLLDNILQRNLYKRLFVFNKERNPKDWGQLVGIWEKCDHRKRLNLLLEIESSLVKNVEDRLLKDPPSEAVTAEILNKLETRQKGQLPIILIDVPIQRPGSSIPLYYVLEAQRRALRRDARAIGDAIESEIWREFGTGLRDRAGNVRIFCHPNYIDSVESVVSRETFVEIFENATKLVI